jgi:phosphoribosylanthranilate isomerase
MNRRTRIKFCGITRIEDAQIAAALGVDAIGLVFARDSQRRVDLARAIEIRRSLPPLVTAAALFMDDEARWVEEIVSSLMPDMLQFHGSEDAAYCDRFRCRYLKAVAMAQEDDLDAAMARFPRATGFVLDSHALGGAGGSGLSFDWSRIGKVSARPWLLAGGLTAQTVGSAIERLRPFAVDVSSGIESAPGIKDPARMREFVASVAAADALLAQS